MLTLPAPRKAPVWDVSEKRKGRRAAAEGPKGQRVFERPSPAYYDDQVVAVVQNSSLFDGIDDLKGTTFGTMSGANAAPLLTNKFAEMGFSKEIVRVVEDDSSHVIFDTWTLLQYPTYQELSDALEEETFDAMVLDGAIAKTYPPAPTRSPASCASTSAS